MVSQCVYYPGMPVSLLSIKVSKPEMQQEEFGKLQHGENSLAFRIIGH